MKKIVIVFISLFIFLPGIVNAKVDYDITQYYINADIETNGDLLVNELIVLDGEFNGYIRDIVYKNLNIINDGYKSNTMYNATGIELVSISAKKTKKITFDTINDTDFTELTPNQASNYGYTSTKLTYGTSYKMYFRADDETVVFKLTYRIKDVVVLHNDIAELYYTFIGDEFDDPIRDLQIKINLPENDTSNNFRVWAHGELSGEIHPYDNAYLLATVKKLDANSSVDIRTTFSKDLVNEYLVTKKDNNDALEEILEFEEERANIANHNREKMKLIYNTLKYVSYAYFIALILAWIYIYRKYDKELKPSFTNEYNREFIDDYNVEVVDYLMNKTVTSNALSASIMNLIYKKAIKVEELPGEKKKEYKFTLEEQQENLNDTEKYLIEFLFNKVGNNNVFTTKNLKDYAKSTKTCETFNTSYTVWKNKVINDAKKEEFFLKTTKAKLYGVLFFFIALLINFAAYSFNAEVLVAYLTIVAGIIFLIYTLCFSKKSKKGIEHYAKWKAFKKFLNDFGTFDTKELPEIILWERYMVYATVFGLAEKVSKSMNVKIKELEASGMYSYNPTFTDWYVFNSINNDINNAIQMNTTAITAARANSSSSSGSGFGGGFSSGGGFGGGGGGGRGF